MEAGGDVDIDEIGDCLVGTQASDDLVTESTRLPPTSPLALFSSHWIGIHSSVSVYVL